MGLFSLFFICAMTLIAQSLTKDDAKIGGIFFLALAMIDLVLQLKMV